MGQTRPKAALRYSQSFDTCGRECVLVTPRSASRNATGFDRMEGPRSAWMVNWSRGTPCFANFSLQPIDVAVVQEAASIRATRGLTTPDALIVASGVVAGVQILVCNDARWKGISDTRLEVVVLSDHVPL